MHVSRSVDEPLREGLSWEEIWQGDDRGLIKCWENGRTIRASTLPEKLALTKSIEAGELPELDWVGGLAKKLKCKKFGSLEYLATLQGIKGEPLDIYTDSEVPLTCTKTGTTVVYAGRTIAKMPES